MTISRVLFLPGSQVMPGCVSEKTSEWSTLRGAGSAWKSSARRSAWHWWGVQDWRLNGRWMKLPGYDSNSFAEHKPASRVETNISSGGEDGAKLQFWFLEVAGVNWYFVLRPSKPQDVCYGSLSPDWHWHLQPWGWEDCAWGRPSAGHAAGKPLHGRDSAKEARLRIDLN